MAIVGLVGYAGSGKDSAAIGLTELGWNRVAFADPIREMALAINPRIPNVVSSQSANLKNLVEQVGWTKAKQNPEVRRLLQVIGTEAVRNIIGPNTWLELAQNKIRSSGAPVVVTDVRFANEAAMIKSMGGVLIRITREGVGAVNHHVSDKILTTIPCNGEIVNSGTEEELREALVEMVSRAFPDMLQAQVSEV